MSHPITPELLERLLDQQGAALELFAAQWSDAPEDCVQEAFLELVRHASPSQHGRLVIPPRTQSGDQHATIGRAPATA